MVQVATGAIRMASFKFPSGLKIKLGLTRQLAVNSLVATLVFDIETSALPLEKFDEAQRTRRSLTVAFTFAASCRLENSPA
jgi:hypothetical protein